MSDPIIKIYSEPTEVASAFAEHLKITISESSGPTFSLALSGGSTPKLLFDVLATDYREIIPWDKVHLYWGDERCVPPDHAESNYGMTKKHLLDHIKIPEENVHRIIAENFDVEVNRYSREIASNIADVNDLPAFDLVMLGMGEDGHTASIFPDSIDLITSGEICAIASHPVSGQKRITITGPIINNARQVCFLVTGKGKKEKVNEIFGRNGNWRSYPAAHIDPLHGFLYWFLDQGAAPN